MSAKLWSRYTRRALLHAGTMLAIVTPLATQAAPHTVEELFRAPMTRGAALSSDAARVAIAFRSADSPGDVIAVMEAADVGKASATIHRFSIGEKEKTSVEWLSWATPERLLVGVDLYWNPPSLSTRKRTWMGSRVYAVNKDGTNPVLLFGDSPRSHICSYNLARIIERPANDPEHVLMPAWSQTSYDLFKVNIHTGHADRIEKGNRQTIAWITEEGRAVLRSDVNDNGTYVSMYGRTEVAEEWSLLTRYGRYDNAREWTYAGDAPGPKNIYVRSYSSADKEGIYSFNLATRSIGESVASVRDYDMDEALVVGGKYVGASYISDRRAYLFANPTTQKHFDGIDTFFGRGANIHIVGIDAAQTVMLLYVSGPKAPGDFYVYDVATKNLQLLMSARPWLDPERLANVEVQTIPTRDGKTITTYLTWPEGKREALPVVMLPHGGPRERDSLQFDPVAQSLAAQGWLVVQPNFRGSSGYGKAFAEAGYRQLSGLMQDDVTDTVTDLARRGVIDPHRVVIFGASYGGYSALAGAVVTPTMYRAIASMAGVTDLPEFMDWHLQREGRDSPAYKDLIERIGDPKQGLAAMIAASPNRRAAEIRVPVLLVHGKVDGVVPIEQSEMMLKSLKKVGKNGTLISVIGEGHGSWSPENNILMMSSVIDFFRPHLTAAAASQQ